MPLSNSQYDEIMREYDQRQLQDRRILDERRKEVFQKIPKLKELESTVAFRRSMMQMDRKSIRQS